MGVRHVFCTAPLCNGHVCEHTCSVCFYLLGMSTTLLPTILNVFDHGPPLAFLGRLKPDADQGRGWNSIPVSLLFP